MKTAEKAPVNTFINSTISDAMVQFMNVNILQPEQLSPVLSPALANYKVCLYDPENFKESEILMMHGLKPHSKTLLFYLTHENYVSLFQRRRYTHVVTMKGYALDTKFGQSPLTI